MNVTCANCQRETPFLFSTHASIGTGGFSPLALYPENTESLQELIKDFIKTSTPYYVVGNLTNVLPPDGECEKMMVSLKCFKDVRRTPNGLYAEAGVTSAELLRVCKQTCLSGAEFLEGIPCTLGGALYMNAGVSGEYISKLVKSVTVLRGGMFTVLPVEACKYSYKNSVFMQNTDIIVGAEIALEKGSAEMIEERIAYYRERRRHLPKGRSMGCVFKNPDGRVAGQLIEGAGLKGLKNGGAFISDVHANFIINGGGATSKQIKTLITIVKNAVYARYGISLQEEIRYIT